MEETYAILCPSLMYMDNSWGPYAETYVSRGTISFHCFQADVRAQLPFFFSDSCFLWLAVRMQPPRIF